MLLYNSPGCASTVGGAPHGSTCLRGPMLSVAHSTRCALYTLEHPKWEHQRLPCPPTIQSQAHRTHWRSPGLVCPFGLAESDTIGPFQTHFGQNHAFGAHSTRCALSNQSGTTEPPWLLGCALFTLRIKQPRWNSRAPLAPRLRILHAAH